MYPFSAFSKVNEIFVESVLFNVYIHTCPIFLCLIGFNLLNFGVRFNIALTCDHLTFGCLCLSMPISCATFHDFSWLLLDTLSFFDSLIHNVMVE